MTTPSRTEAPPAPPPPRSGASWEDVTRGDARWVRGRGRTPEVAFEQAAVALCARVADPAAVEVREEVPVTCEPADLDRLLADWLRALVHLMASRELRFHCFVVRMDGRRLFASAFGERLDPARHGARAQVRGATVSDPRVRRGADGQWVAECEVEV
ncbi:archease [Myxococcus sp. K15C18031901]|uniref:archease n=1 Tax=Myxococcus dinghuensis TaxID=2906761 RepID=UPI0020A6ED2B|nr:archease [Myxococcus dinghuensis]MCP3102564.1 archease [Myxococcus dinghuensis]